MELKSGETYNGHLDSCDTWMNINLKDVICTSRVSAQRTQQMQRCSPCEVWIDRPVDVEQIQTPRPLRRGPRPQSATRFASRTASGAVLIPSALCCGFCVWWLLHLFVSVCVSARMAPVSGSFANATFAATPSNICAFRTACWTKSKRMSARRHPAEEIRLCKELGGEAGVAEEGMDTRNEGARPEAAREVEADTAVVEAVALTVAAEEAAEVEAIEAAAGVVAAVTPIEEDEEEAAVAAVDAVVVEVAVRQEESKNNTAPYSPFHSCSSPFTRPLHPPPSSLSLFDQRHRQPAHAQLWPPALSDFLGSDTHTQNVFTFKSKLRALALYMWSRFRISSLQRPSVKSLVRIVLKQSKETRARTKRSRQL